MRVLVLGGTGTIGAAAVRALQDRGHDVTAPGRDGLGLSYAGFDAVVCCLASRTGEPADAWAVDHGLTVAAIDAAKAAGVATFVLLSAICVQRPRLAFQHAKLAAEQALRESGLAWTIVRPTAFFKSLSGQVARVRRGKPFLVFGDGRLTACKPISDADLGRFLAECVEDAGRRGQILPIGGPGPAVTPLDQAAMLGAKARRVPVRLLDTIIAALSILGLKAKAEYARIGRYYATESMLVWDPDTNRYDADATPEYGTDTLEAHYARLLALRPS